MLIKQSWKAYKVWFTAEELCRHGACLLHTQNWLDSKYWEVDTKFDIWNVLSAHSMPVTCKFGRNKTSRK